MYALKNTHTYIIINGSKEWPCVVFGRKIDEKWRIIFDDFEYMRTRLYDRVQLSIYSTRVRCGFKVQNNMFVFLQSKSVHECICLYRLLDGPVVECCLRVREVPGSPRPQTPLQSRTASYQIHYKNGISSALV